MTTTHPDPHTCPARGVELRTADEIKAERQHYRMRAEKLGWVVGEWQPIETAPRRYSPPLSTVNHHAPDILGLWGQAFYCTCRWGGPSQPYWIGGDNKRIPFQPTRWMPLPPAPAAAPASPA